jgi:hypothetical protein
MTGPMTGPFMGPMDQMEKARARYFSSTMSLMVPGALEMRAEAQKAPKKRVATVEEVSSMSKNEVVRRARTDCPDVGCQGAGKNEQDEHAEGYYVDGSSAVHLVLLAIGLDLMAGGRTRL